VATFFCFVLAEVPSAFPAKVPSTLTASTLTVSLAGVIIVDLHLAVISRISVQYE